MNMELGQNNNEEDTPHEYSREELQQYLDSLIFKYAGTNISISTISMAENALHPFELRIKDLQNPHNDELFVSNTAEEVKRMSLEAAKLDNDGKNFTEIIETLSKKII